MTTEFTPTQSEAIGRIGGLVLVNAMIFQEVLSERNDQVLSLQELVGDEPNIINALATHWRFIVNKINYYPIFHIAYEIVEDITSAGNTVDALRTLVVTAQRIVGKRAALRHDLMGRVYHRLLVDKKFLGTYYTSIPAATMLLKLALRADSMATDWHDLEKVRGLRIADLSCGTGTLLMAAADAVTDNYIRESARRGQVINAGLLQNKLAEEVIYGYDVLPSAIHLTASTLALRAPEIAFKEMKLWSLPLGGADHRLGSIEYMAGSQIRIPLDMFGAHEIKGKGIELQASAELPMLDLCVMNPPFTRSVGGNLLFGSMPEEIRQKMQSNLKKMVQKHSLSASITAGLGSVFVAIADPFVKYGGRIALVLPKALLSGVSWQPTRDLLKKKYRVEFVIASHDPSRWNFSESTKLSEVLVVAKKIRNNSVNGSEEEQNGETVALNLWRNPTTAFDALAVAQALIKNTPPALIDSQGALDVTIGKEKIGEAVRISWPKLKNRSSWLLPCAFAQSDLIRAALHLVDGQLWLPGHGIVGQIKLCPLQELGQLGPDRRGVHDGFKLSQAKTAFASFWGHRAKLVYTMAQHPNQYLSPLGVPKKGQVNPIRKIEHLWPLAGNVLLAERMRLNTQRLAAVLLSQPVLSNVWWPLALQKAASKSNVAKALVLWLNSTPGFISLLAHREDTEGAWIGFKKTVLTKMPILNPLALSPSELKTLAAAYDRLSFETILPFSQMSTDPVRAQIDESVRKALKLPDFTILRVLLSQEPIICLKRL
jgi:hypothetical protein